MKAFAPLNLSSEEIENLLFLAEQQARKFIFTQIPPKEIKNLEVLIELDNTNGLNLDCIIDIELVKRSKSDPQRVSEKAVQEVIKFIENELKL